MTIRLAMEADKLRLIEMAERFLRETQYGRLFDDKATPQTIGELITNVLTLGAIVVAEIGSLRDGEGGRDVGPPILIGMLAIVALPHPLTGVIYGEEICWWVEPEHRHGTIGPKMLREAEDWATRNGANSCKMVAPAGSTVGDFYERIGYTLVESAYLKRF